MSDMTRSGHRQFLEAGERKYQERKSANVKTVTDRDKGALLNLEDGSAPVWTPDKELARTLLGKPIPEDWTRREGPYGPQALPPRAKGAGGMVAWRNTKEGFEAEAAGRKRWQEIEEEKKDRRTALMQAVAIADDDDPGGLIVIAELFYDWLRESSPAVSDGPKASAPAGDTTSPAAGPGVATPGVATTEANAPPPQAGATPSVIGEEAGEEPGEDAWPKPSPGSTNITASPQDYPMSTDECDHKFASGGWLKTRTIDGQARCPRCGMSAVIYRESA